MRRTRAIVITSALALSAAAAGSLAADEPDPCAGQMCAGAGIADATPPVGVSMGGFFSRSVASNPPAWAAQASDRGPDPNLHAKTFRQSEGIHTLIQARALVVQATDGRRFAFASVENRGAPYELHQAVIDRLAEAGAGIPAERLVFSSTHSHAAPSPMNPYTGYGIISADLFDPRIFRVAVESLTEAILRGAERLEPARVGVGEADLLGASANRRMEQFLRNHDVPPGHTDRFAPPAIDSQLALLRAEALDGRPIGAFYTFGLHGTTLGADNLLLSGDNMGPAMRFCEETLAARAAAADSAGPPPVCAQANGAEGDISPQFDGTGLHVPSAYARAEQTGRQVAAAALEAWDAAVPTEDLLFDARKTVLVFSGQEGDPGEPTSPVPSVGFGGNFGDGVALPVSLPGIGNKIPIGVAPGGYPQWAPLQIIRAGDMALLSVPAEMTVQMARRVRAAVLAAAGAEAPGLLTRTAIVGLANSYVSYMTTPEEYEAALYEGAWSLYGPQTGNLVRNELARLAGDLAAGRRPVEPQAPPLGPLLAASDAPVAPDDPDRVGEIVAEVPASLVRGEVLSFSWVGGNPGVERPRGGTFVSLEREDGGAWVTAASENDLFSIVRTERPSPAGPHTWTAAFDLPLDLRAGSYRIRVAGRYAAPGGSAAYDAVSAVVAISPSEDLEPFLEVRSGPAGEVEATVRGRWPAPAGERYRTRPLEASEGEAVVTILRDGSVTATRTVALGVPTLLDAAQPGDILRIGAGDLLDISGNTNSMPVEGSV